MSRSIASLALVLALSLPSALAAQAPAKAPAPNPAEKGWEAYRAGDLNAAMAAAREALKVAQGDPQVLELYARCSLALAEPSSATGALNLLASRRGTLNDLLLLAAAQEMTGKFAEARKALERAETGKEPTAEGLYALAYRKEDAASRAALLRRIASEYPATAPGLAGEIALWAGLGDAKLRVASAVPAGGATLEMKTLYDLEWAPCKAGEEDLWLMVDTAARETVLSKETAEKLKLTVAPVSMPLSGSPQVTDLGIAVVPKIDFGAFQVASVPVLVVPDPAGTLKYREGRAVLKGVLGMDLLRGLKVRFDRKKSELRLYPAGTPEATLLDGDPSGWRNSPAYSLHDQVLVKSGLNERTSALGLLATGCSLVLVPEGTLAGTGVQADSRKVVDLAPAGDFQMEQATSQAGGMGSTGGHSSVSRNRRQVLGWLDELYPMVGRVRTVPKATQVGFGGSTFEVNDLPVYPGTVGDPVPASVVVGKKVTDFFALALDLGAGKVYFKQTLFAK